MINVRGRGTFSSLRCGTKDHVLLVPQSRQRINSRRSPCWRIASEYRGAQEDDTGQRQSSRIIRLGFEQKRFDKLGRSGRVESLELTDSSFIPMLTKMATRIPPTMKDISRMIWSQRGM